MISLLLLMRQYIDNQDRGGFSLKEQEELENYNFKDLVEKSHQKFKKKETICNH